MADLFGLSDTHRAQISASGRLMQCHKSNARTSAAGMTFEVYMIGSRRSPLEIPSLCPPSQFPSTLTTICYHHGYHDFSHLRRPRRTNFGSRKDRAAGHHFWTIAWNLQARLHAMGPEIEWAERR